MKEFVQIAREKGDLTDSPGLIQEKASDDNSRLDELLEADYNELSVEEFKKNADEIIGLVFKEISRDIFISSILNRQKLKSIRQNESFEKTWKKLKLKYDNLFGRGKFDNFKLSFNETYSWQK